MSDIFVEREIGGRLLRIETGKVARLASGTPLTCEIGATGVRFDGETQLAEGSHIFLQIMLEIA